MVVFIWHFFLKSTLKDSPGEILGDEKKESMVSV